MTTSPTWTPIHCLEQNVRLYLALTHEPIGQSSDPADGHRQSWLQDLQAIHDKRPAGQEVLRDMAASGRLQEPYRPGDLRQACNNVLAQIASPEPPRLLPVPAAQPARGYYRQLVFAFKE